MRGTCHVRTLVNYTLLDRHCYPCLADRETHREEVKHLSSRFHRRQVSKDRNWTS